MRLRHLVPLVVIIVLSSAATAQDWNITGAGARAEGFGGAFIGVADDATAIVWNPAGLGQLERAEVSAVGRYISETSESKSTSPTQPYTVSNIQSHYNFNFASLAVPFKAGSTNIVLAVAYQTQLDFYAKETDINKNQTERTGAASTVTPGIALRLGSMLSLGLATNIWMGSFDYSTTYATGGTDKLSPSFSGLNFGVGALLDFGGLSNPVPLKLGVSVKTPFTLKADIDYTFSGIPGKANLEGEMPLMVGVGASYQFGQSFTLAADYEMRQYKDKKSKVTTVGISTSDLLSASNEDLNQFRVGAEYLIVMSGGVIPLRVGFRTVPTVLANYVWNRDSLNYYPTDQIKGTGYSAGTGFISNSFALDFAYSHELHDEQTWKDAGVTYYTTNYNADRFSLSLIVYF
jgi:long-subunit fatty acid transport protein